MSNRKTHNSLRNLRQYDAMQLPQNWMRIPTAEEIADIEKRQDERRQRLGLPPIVRGKQGTTAQG